jgi:alkylation response protein AidB-like acyl-CoA dehydrogenase
VDFTLTDEQQMLREGAERYLLESYTFEDRKRTLDADTRCREEAWQAFAELGWLALAVPESAGGLGAGLFEATVVAEALGRRAVLEPYATSAVLAVRLLERGDDSSRHAALLGEIAAGALRVAVACWEPDRHYELAPAATTARRAGDGYVLSGRKMLAYDAPSAHRLLVSASLDGEPALFVVDAQAAGVTRRAYPLIDGHQAADVDFDDVTLPGTALLCAGAGTAGILEEAIDRLRVFEVAEALGAMERAMDLTAEHLRNRRQFGKPLAAFQALQHRMAEMFVEVQETRSGLYHALAHFDAEPARRSAAVSSAKVVAIEAGRIVGGQGIQLHGGVGLTSEYQVGHYYKRLLVLERAWGDLDFHLDRIARTYT